jgi:hypothetical protein
MRSPTSPTSDTALAARGFVLFAERAVNEPGMRCTRGHFHAGVSERNS